MSTKVILRPQPFSSYFTLPVIEGRPKELFHFDDLEFGDEWDEEENELYSYISSIDQKEFKFRMIRFDMEHWTQEQKDEFYAEWNTDIDSLILIQ